MKPDRDKANAVKEELNNTEETNDELKTSSPALKKTRKLSPKTMAFMRKLSDGLYSELSENEWIMYFQMKYKEVNDRGYYIDKANGSYTKANAIFKGLLMRYNPKDVKLMIDFLFEADHDIKPKNQIAIYMLSKGWLDTIYSDALLWRDGEYLNRAQFNAKKYKEAQPNKRNREWIPPEEKKEEPEAIIPKRKKKSTITLC
jgi:hypothetical protein